jgi:hypothetical protein
MASPLPRPPGAGCVPGAPGTHGARTAAAGAAPRLRVVGPPELVVDDDHPDFAYLPRHRSR